MKRWASLGMDAKWGSYLDHHFADPLEGRGPSPGRREIGRHLKENLSLSDPRRRYIKGRRHMGQR